MTQRVGWVENPTSRQIPIQKIIYKQAACRSDSRIRHLFAEQGSHIALALRPNVGFKNPTYADDAAELLLFCKVIFLDWYYAKLHATTA